MVVVVLIISNSGMHQRTKLEYAGFSQFLVKADGDYETLIGLGCALPR